MRAHGGVAPEIHAMTEIDYRDHYIQNTPETRCRHGLDAQRAIWPAIESIARARSCWGSPALIEGWAILPNLFFGADLPDVDACWLVADEPTPDGPASLMSAGTTRALF